jgi:hypothetical protein
MIGNIFGKWKIIEIIGVRNLKTLACNLEM